MRLKEEEKVEYINLWKESGLSKSEFCKKMGLSYQGFLMWNKKISIESNEDSDSQKTRIIPVKIIQDTYQSTESYVVIQLRSCSIKIMPRFPQSDLRKILELLEV